MRERIRRKISLHYQQTKIRLNNRFPHLYYHLDNNKLIIKFFIAASFTGLVDFFCLFVLYDIIGENILFSSSAAFILAFFFNFRLNKVWTFRHQHAGDNRELFSYLSLNLVKLFFNSLLMYYLVVSKQMWYVYAQLIIGFFLNLAAFFLTKLFVFVKKD